MGHGGTQEGISGFHPEPEEDCVAGSPDQRQGASSCIGL